MLTKSTLVRRERLYFDKFRYRLVFNMWCVGWTEYRRTFQEFNEELTKRLSENKRYPTTWNSAIPYPDCENVDTDAISKFIDYRNQYHPRNHSATIAGIYTSGNTARVFTNDLNIINESFNLGGFNYSLSEVELQTVEPGVKLFSRQPKYRYRTYFKEKRVSQDWKDNLDIFLKNHPEIVPCGAIKRFLSTTGWRGSRISNSHFVEYDNHSGIMLLVLSLDNEYLAKHYELKRKE